MQEKHSCVLCCKFIVIKELLLIIIAFSFMKYDTYETKL